MRLTCFIVVLHILQRAELGLRCDGVSLAALVYMCLACNEGEDVWFAVFADTVKVRYKSSSFAWFSLTGILNSVMRIIPAIFPFLLSLFL